MRLFEGNLLLEYNLTCGKCIIATVKLKRRGIHMYITCRCMYVLPDACLYVLPRLFVAGVGDDCEMGRCG